MSLLKTHKKVHSKKNIINKIFKKNKINKACKSVPLVYLHFMI